MERSEVGWPNSDAMTPLLFPDHGPDFKFKGAGHRRSHVGAIIEEAVCGVMGWTRCKIDSTRGCVSHDAEDALGRKIEIKSVSVSDSLKGKSVLYDFRMKKESMKCPSLLYCFVCRPSKGRGRPSSAKTFLDRMAGAKTTIIIARSGLVHELAFECPHNKAPVRRHRGNKGYTREGYCEGYRNFPVNHLLDLPHDKVQVSGTLWFREFNFQVILIHGAEVSTRNNSLPCREVTRPR